MNKTMLKTALVAVVAVAVANRIPQARKLIQGQ